MDTRKLKDPNTWPLIQNELTEELGKVSPISISDREQTWEIIKTIMIEVSTKTVLLY